MNRRDRPSNIVTGTQKNSSVPLKALYRYTDSGASSSAVSLRKSIISVDDTLKEKSSPNSNKSSLTKSTTTTTTVINHKQDSSQAESIKLTSSTQINKAGRSSSTQAKIQSRKLSDLLSPKNAIVGFLAPLAKKKTQTKTITEFNGSATSPASSNDDTDSAKSNKNETQSLSNSKVSVTSTTKISTKTDENKPPIIGRLIKDEDKIPISTAKTQFDRDFEKLFSPSVSSPMSASKAFFPLSSFSEAEKKHLPSHAMISTSQSSPPTTPSNYKFSSSCYSSAFSANTIAKSSLVSAATFNYQQNDEQKSTKNMNSPRTSLSVLHDLSKSEVKPKTISHVAESSYFQAKFAESSEQKDEIFTTSLRNNSEVSKLIVATTRMALKDTIGVRGIKNYSTTCFMNATIQCLSNTPLFRNFFLFQAEDATFLEKATNRNSKMKGKLVRDFQDLITDLWEPIDLTDSENFTSFNSISSSSITRTQPNSKIQYSSIDSIDIQDFQHRFCKYAPIFGSRQHDAQEFLRFLLEGIHEDLNRVTEKPAFKELPDPDPNDLKESSDIWWDNYKNFNNSEIIDLFSGQFISSLTCYHCGAKSYSFDPFMDISLSLPKSSTSFSYMHQLSRSKFYDDSSNSYSSSSISFSDLMKAFFGTEILSCEDILCQKCKKRQNCAKQLSIFRIPKILVIHLKRFSSSGKKLEFPVSFPVDDLKVSEFVHPSAKDLRDNKVPSYSLCGFVNHYGTLISGHYFAYCRRFGTGKSSSGIPDDWILFNDAKVSKKAQSDIDCTDAYILFYQRNDL